MKSEDCRWSVGNTGTLEGFISPNGKLIAGYPSTHIDVRMFGEIGSSDDASVIQQAIDYATTLTWGGVVTIPINTTLNVSNVILKNKVGIESSSRSGRKARLQSVGADSGGMITLATGGLIDCSVRNLSLRGDATHTSNGGVIVPFGVNNTVDVSPTSGMVQDIGVTGSGTTGAVSTSSHEILRVTTSAVEIKTITGFHITTKTVTLIANGGSIIFNTSGNINLGGRASPFTLTSDKSATFMVTDIAGVKAYRLITVSS